MRLLKKSKEVGFTLIELLVAIAIIGILAMAGLPDLGAYLANSKLKEASNTFTSQAIFARNEALKRNSPVSLVVNGDTLTVSKITGVNTSTVVRTVKLPGGVSAPAFAATFDSSGLLTPFGTQATASFALQGRSCSDVVPCPSVRVESGGSVKVCQGGTCS